MAKKRENVFVAEWQQIAQAQGEPDTSPEGLKRTRHEKKLFASGAAAVLRHADKHLSKRRRKRLWRALREFRATYPEYPGLITTNMVVRRAIELFRNSNPFLRQVDALRQDEAGDPFVAAPKPGSTIKIRLPADYVVRNNGYDVQTDLERASMRPK